MTGEKKKKPELILESSLLLSVSECTTNLLIVKACQVPDVIKPHLSSLPVLHEHCGCGTERRRDQFVILSNLVLLARFSIDHNI